MEYTYHTCQGREGAGGRRDTGGAAAAAAVRRPAGPFRLSRSSMQLCTLVHMFVVFFTKQINKNNL